MHESTKGKKKFVGAGASLHSSFTTTSVRPFVWRSLPLMLRITKAPHKQGRHLPPNVGERARGAWNIYKDKSYKALKLHFARSPDD